MSGPLEVDTRPEMYLLVLRDHDGFWTPDDQTYDTETDASQAGKDSLGAHYDRFIVVGVRGEGESASPLPEPIVAAGNYLIPPQQVQTKLHSTHRTDEEWREHFRKIIPEVGDSADGMTLVSSRSNLGRIMRDLAPSWPEFRVERRSVPSGRGCPPSVRWSVLRVSA